MSFSESEGRKEQKYCWCYLDTLQLFSSSVFKNGGGRKRNTGEEWKGGGDGGRWRGVGNGVKLLLFFIHFNIDCHILDYEILYEQYKSVQMFVKEIWYTAMAINYEATWRFQMQKEKEQDEGRKKERKRRKERTNYCIIYLLIIKNL